MGFWAIIDKELAQARGFGRTLLTAGLRYFTTPPGKAAKPSVKPAVGVSRYPGVGKRAAAKPTAPSPKKQPTFRTPKQMRAAEAEVAGHIGRVLAGKLDPTRAAARIRELERKDLITPFQAENAIKAFSLITPEMVYPKPKPLKPTRREIVLRAPTEAERRYTGTYLAAAPQRTPYEQKLVRITDAVASGDMPFYEAVGAIRDLGSVLPPERINQGLLAATVNAGRPVEAAPHVKSGVAGAWAVDWNLFQIPSQIITQEFLRATTGQRRVGAGEIIKAAWQGYRAVNDPVTELKNAGYGAGEALIMGGALWAAFDPATYLWGAGGIYGKAGREALEAAEQIGGRLAAKEGSELGNLVYRTMGRKAAEFVAQPLSDMRAFGRGYLQGLPEQLTAVARELGMADDAATSATTRFVTEFQNTIRVQPRLWKMPVDPRPWSLRDIREIVATRNLHIMRQAQEKALRELEPIEATRLSLTAAERRVPSALEELDATRQIGFIPTEHTRELGFWKPPPLTVAGMRHTEFVDMVADNMRQMAAAERSGPLGIKNLGRAIERIFRPAGNIDPTLNTEMTRLAMFQSAERTSLEAQFLRPVSDLTDVESKIVIDSLGQQGIVRSPELMARTGLPAGARWGMSDAEVQQYIAVRLGETIKPNVPLPPQTARLWARSADVRKVLEDGWKIIDDAGLTLEHKEFYIPIKAVSERSGRVRGAVTSFMNQSYHENPYVMEMFRAAGYKNVPEPVTDLPTLLRGYANGVAHIRASTRMTEFVDRYGIQLGENELASLASRVMGWEGFRPPSFGPQATWAKVAEQVRPSALTKVLPPGFNDHWEYLTKPSSEIERWTQRILAPHRMAILNVHNQVFHFSNMFDQFPSTLGAGWPGAENFATGMGAAAREMISEFPEWLLASGPRTWQERLVFGLNKVETGIMDAVDTHILDRISLTRAAQLVGKVAASQGYTDDIIRGILEEASALENMGVAGYLSKFEGDFAGTTDFLLRNSLGLGVRTAGAYENLWRTGMYVGKRLSGTSIPDTTRELWTGYVNYARPAMAPVDRVMKQLTYFWPYARQRMAQGMQITLERPWVTYFPWKLRDIMVSSMPPDDQMLWNNRPDSFKYNYERIPIPPDVWPMTVLTKDIPEELMRAYIPHLSYHALPMNVPADIARLAGLSSFRAYTEPETGTGEYRVGADFIPSLQQSLHPVWRAGIAALRGDLRGAGQELALPIIPGLLDISQQGMERKAIINDTIGPELGNQLCRYYRLPQKLENYPYARALALASIKAADAGVILTFNSKVEDWQRTPTDDVDDFQLLRQEQGRKPVPLAASQLTDIKQRYTTATGKPAPESPAIQTYMLGGGRVGEVIQHFEEVDRKEREAQIGLDDWLKLRKQNQAEDKPPPEISDAMVRDFNNLLRQSKSGYDLVTKEQMQAASTSTVPANLSAMGEWYRKRGPANRDECSADMQKALLGACGHGDAEKIGDWFVKNKGYTTMPQGTAPQPGDIVWFPTGNVHGHVGLTFYDPAKGSDKPRLYSNYAGTTGFMDMPTDRRLSVYRPPQTTPLDLVLKRLGK